MPVINTLSDAVVGLVVVIVIVGIVLGLSLAGTDLLNPRTAEAKTNEMNEATRHENRLNTLKERKLEEELRHQTQVNTLQEQKLAREAQLEAEYRERQSGRRLEVWQLRENALTVAGALCLVIMVGGITVLGVRLGGQLAEKPQPTSLEDTAETKEFWSSPTLRQAAIQMARENERNAREALLASTGTQNRSEGVDEGRHQEPIILDLKPQRDAEYAS